MKEYNLKLKYAGITKNNIVSVHITGIYLVCKSLGKWLLKSKAETSVIFIGFSNSKILKLLVILFIMNCMP